MIEKLKTIDPYSQEELDMSVGSLGGLVYENTPLVQKINELVDAVNNIVVETKHEAPADPYAEQRKWIGKVCKFWDNNENIYYGLLTEINDINPYCYEYNHKLCYKHCKPVKPDDSIIYKGV